jgi:deoxycytidine triphosphate deaminase
MGVIPLTTQGTTPTIITGKTAFNPAGTAVKIINFDHEQLRGMRGESNLSYDLRVGSLYRDHRERLGQGHTLREGEEITLYPGTAVIIQTLEHVEFPHSRFAYIAPKVSLLQLALTNTLSKVDPGYQGPLLVTLFNAGKTRQQVTHGQRFCALVVHEIAPGTPVLPHSSGAKQIVEPPTPRSRWRVLKDRVDQHHSVILLVLVVLYVLQIMLKVGPTVLAFLRSLGAVR